MANRYILGRRLQREIAKLDPERDDQRMFHLALEVLYGDPRFVHAVFLVTFARQAAVPSIANVLYRNGHGEIVLDPARRNDATMTYFGEFVRLGYESVEGIAAIDHLERIHSYFPITDEEKLYTLATIVIEPERQIDYVGARHFAPEITESAWHFWHGIANRMSPGELGHDRAAFKQWMLDFERRNYAYSPAGYAIAQALLEDWATRWFPTWFKPHAKQMILGVMDDDVRATLGLPEPARWARAFMHWRGRSYMRNAPFRIVPLRRTWTQLWGKRFDDPTDLTAVGYRPPEFHDVEPRVISNVEKPTRQSVH